MPALKSTIRARSRVFRELYITGLLNLIMAQSGKMTGLGWCSVPHRRLG